MTWEYRVVKHICGDWESLPWFTIYEVYHNGNDELSWTVKSKAPIGDSPDELRVDLKMMLRAFDLPILEEKDGTLVEVDK